MSIFRRLTAAAALAVIAAACDRVPSGAGRKSQPALVVQRLGAARLSVRYNRPSMMQHVEQGRRTEIDALNGALVREARALGIPLPYNEAIVAVVKGLEKSRRQRLHEPPIDYARREEEAEKEAKKNYTSEVDKLRDILRDAQAYAKASAARTANSSVKRFDPSAMTASL